MECPRCHHLFPQLSRLQAHANRKQRCHPNSHFRTSAASSPSSSSASSPASAAASASSSLSASASSSVSSPSASVATRRWSRNSRTGQARFNVDAYSLSVASQSADCIRLRVSLRQREERLEPSRLQSEYVCHANDVMSLKLIRSGAEMFHEFGSFHPAFTHQLFPDEEVVGYRKLSVQLYLTAGSLFTLLLIDYDESVGRGSDDVYGQIASKLAPGFTTDVATFTAHIGEPFTPPGERVAAYSVPSVDSAKDAVTYEIWKGSFSSAAVRAYHARLQFFLLLFIDRSSFINDSDGLWEILLLMERRVARASAAVSYAVVGYTTLYKFLCWPDAWRLRLSQIIILPPFQRCGHGARLLQYVYDEAALRRFAELNVEDPAPVFRVHPRHDGRVQLQAPRLLPEAAQRDAGGARQPVRRVGRGVRRPRAPLAAHPAGSGAPLLRDLQAGADGHAAQQAVRAVPAGGQAQAVPGQGGDADGQRER